MRPGSFRLDHARAHSGQEARRDGSGRWDAMSWQAMGGCENVTCWAPTATDSISCTQREFCLARVACVRVCNVYAAVSF